MKIIETLFKISVNWQLFNLLLKAHPNNHKSKFIIFIDFLQRFKIVWGFSFICRYSGSNLRFLAETHIRV